MREGPRYLRRAVGRGSGGISGWVVLFLVGFAVASGARAGVRGADAHEGVRHAAAARPAPELSWRPERPVQGRLFVVRVTSRSEGPPPALGGRFAGEVLHFRRVAGEVGTYESLAAVPVDAPESMELTVEATYPGGRRDTLAAVVPVEGGSFSHERLTVAPRFGGPPSAEDRARLERERAMAREVSRVAHGTPRLWTGEAVLPRDDRVTSGFGDGRVFNGRVSGRHMGLDLDGEPGDTVVAAARGVVALVEAFLLAGNIVYLNHGDGLVSGYFHLSEQLVAVGDTVRAGTPIGRVGATGRVTGPHLHWVVRYGTTSVDPRSLLDVW